jgi:hypothetical protein
VQAHHAGVDARKEIFANDGEQRQRTDNDQTDRHQADRAMRNERRESGRIGLAQALETRLESIKKPADEGVGVWLLMLFRQQV